MGTLIMLVGTTLVLLVRVLYKAILVGEAAVDAALVGSEAIKKELGINSQLEKKLESKIPNSLKETGE